MTKTICALALTAAVIILPLASKNSPVFAHGAVAVGTTADVAKDGIAIGTAVNSKSASDAQSTALQYCKDYKAAPKAAALCKVVSTFRKECYSIAFDPEPGTPGAGWAVAAVRETAEERAMDACKASAGAGREQFCKIEQTRCDTVD
jgi:hypothetical protein